MTNDNNNVFNNNDVNNNIEQLIKKLFKLLSINLLSLEYVLSRTRKIVGSY